MNIRRVACGAVMGLVIALVFGAGCGGDTVPKAVRDLNPVGVPFLEREEPPSIQPLRNVELMPGEQAPVLVVVDRNGNEGPVTAAVKDLPPGITATVEPAVDVDEKTANITIKVAADTTLGDSPLDAQCSLDIAVKDKTVTRKLEIKVPQVGRPEVPAQPPFLIQPGTSTTWHVPIARNGFEGPIDFRATPSSETLAVEASTAREDQAEVPLEIAIPATAPEGDVSCRLEWTSYGRAMTAELPVRIVRDPLRMPAVAPVTLRPGEHQEQTLVIERSGYAGPVTLTLGNLPAGVTAAPSPLTLEADTASAVFSAAEAAPAAVAFVPVRISAGHLSAQGLISVRVLGDTARESLPQDVLAELPAGVRRKSVAARTAPAARERLAGLYGSTEDSGPAVMRALRWLASRQVESGAWQPMVEAGLAGGASADGGAVATTALALLPFLAEGLTSDPDSALSADTEPYPDVVKNGLAFLGTAQPDDGEQAGAIGTSMTSHLLGLVAFSEAFALADNDDKKSRDDVEARKEWKDRAERAVDRLIKFQGKKNGEWAVGREEDTARDTAFAAVALQTARSHGIGVPVGPLRKAVKHLETYQTADPPPGSRFSPPQKPSSRFSAPPKQPADAELTALCLLAMLGDGRAPDAPEIVAGCDFLAGFAPACGAARAERPPLFFVVAGEALRTVEGERYDAWNATLRSFLTARQVQEGDLAGSWDPAIFGGESAGAGDRVWATACAAICLQSHFRSLSLSRGM